MFILIYRRNGELNIQTQHIGPFETWETAFEYLCALPAIGVAEAEENPGVKYIAELSAPDFI